MKTEFRIEYLSEEELQKPKSLQRPLVVRVTLDGERNLSDALIALLKTKYKLI